MDAAEKVVCVTGASGYIASWLVKLLLHRGYTVKATVRDPDDRKRTHHLLALDGAKERLHLFKADLLEEGSFDAVVQGCIGVFHTASPVLFTCTDPKVEIIDPALKGTLNVLSSCAKVSTIKRVVVTSSMASVIYTGRPLTPDVMVDETWFSDPVLCEESKNWYMLSKTLAEQAAWKFASDNRIDMVTLHPGFVIGPLLQPTLNLSAEIFLTIAKGAGNIPMESCRFIDVRDTAQAHVAALELPSATGRYCLVKEVMLSQDALAILQKLYPEMKLLGKSEEGERPFSPVYQVSREKAERLGISFTPLEVSFKDTVESLQEKGFL
ncbi:hypothetical protein MLD38_002783 [Melastoma candidum]|uniref:Uncharacterized protein n=1 Tax=Melastoma candidum TaxID=119954 RepID=A0ACB9RZQ5_9MYRT|nr:hypothetical protein MLD38_002783 [Melastoma candidum]